MRIFISHAWEDKPLALELVKLPAFIDPWVDIRELAGGQELDPTIQLAIEESHVFIALLSQHSTGKAWVEKELEWALHREEEKDRVFVLPVIRKTEFSALITICCLTPFVSPDKTKLVSWVIAAGALKF